VNSQPKNAKYRPEPIIELLLTMMSVISAVAEFERDLLLEHTHSGIARKNSWKAIWSPFSTE